MSEQFCNKSRGIVHDRSHIPPHYVPLGKYCSKKGGTPEYNYLHRAFHSNKTVHPVYECTTGNASLFMHEDDVTRLLSEYSDSRKVLAESRHLDTETSDSTCHSDSGNSEQSLKQLAEKIVTLSRTLADVSRQLNESFVSFLVFGEDE